MFHTGQKVVCIDDQFCEEVHKLYTSLPKKDTTYVIRGINDGQSVNALVMDYRCVQEPAVYLIGLFNPCNSKGLEFGFSSNRFRSLEELKDKTRQSQEKEDLAIDRLIANLYCQ